ncbi:hypothetical protein [Anaeromicropila populeti]|uniref:Uncharacterized protein n=1 Tax=Anaeromicropila populeti TaxID=37658 RepID=A0A1I6I782_9FIRM|nr:hypothetical protein [Anaeromicropila populeti]SFR62592.1 hypothetical protein SAMN05661086_00504 [Anaeromicropila populeti]
MSVENTGEEEVLVYTDGDGKGTETDKRAYISSQDAKYLTWEDEGRRIHVYGNAVHAYIGENDNGDGNKYGYFNMENGLLPIDEC